MKSRILAVLCALILTAGTLAGCGGTRYTSGGKEETKTEETKETTEDKKEETVEDQEPVSDEEAEKAGFSDGTDGEDVNATL